MPGDLQVLKIYKLRERVGAIERVRCFCYVTLGCGATDHCGCRLRARTAPSPRASSRRRATLHCLSASRSRWNHVRAHALVVARGADRLTVAS